VLGAILSVFASGLLIGWLARWGVPGPDPMPLWLTFLFGLGGSLVGGVTTAVALGGTKDVSNSDYFTIVLAEILAAMLLIILYRRFVQGRPITGPEAHKQPTKGIGVGGRNVMRGRLGHRRGSTRSELLKRLDELHDQGVLTDEEYLAKRAEVLRREP
jgi:uncharacterized membrane protein YeaQ/YmgE (transglycosylase-associated protein family)